MMTANLRPLTEADSDLLFRWRNAEHVRRNMYTDHEISRDEHDRWFPGALQDRSRVYWIIQDGERPIGMANLYDISQRHKTAVWAFYIGEQDVIGKGIGLATELAVVSHAFDVLGLDKLSCEVLTMNERVIRMHERFGFRREGYFRSHVLKADGRHDMVSLAMLREEWERLKPTYQPVR